LIVTIIKQKFGAKIRLFSLSSLLSPTKKLKIDKNKEKGKTIWKCPDYFVPLHIERNPPKTTTLAAGAARYCGGRCKHLPRPPQSFSTYATTPIQLALRPC
jgi:hypothetical protein